MMETEYYLELAEGTIAYVHFRTARREVTRFVVKLLVAFGGEQHEVLRYDSGHGCSHKDILGKDGEVIRKVWYHSLDHGQVLTMAIRDLKDHHELHRERYQEWLRER